MLKKTRSRGPNFTKSESLLLCDIISEYKSIIENKKTDGANLHQKQEAWIKITEKFNAVAHGHHRTVESLQMNYKNLKKKVKKKASDAKMDIPVERATPVQKIEEYGTSSEAWEQVAATTRSSKHVCQSLFNIMAKEVNTKDKQFKKHIMGTGGGAPLKSDDDPLLDKVKCLVGRGHEEMEYIAVQKELIKLQLIEEQEKLEHNRLLRNMELEDARLKYEHNEKLRKLELEKFYK